MMKNCLILMTFLMLAIAGFGKNKKVVHSPYFESRNNNRLEIGRVTLYPDSTVLHVQIYGEPGHEVDILSSATIEADGRLFPLLSKSGFAPKGYTRVPVSGCLNGRLIFKPIPLQTTKMNFSEGGDDGWAVYGVRLDGYWPKVTVPEEWTTTPDDRSRPLPAAVTQFGKAQFKGRIFGLPRGSTPITVGYVMSDWVCWRFAPQPISVASDGSFSVDIDLMTPGIKQFKLGNSVLRVFLVPGGKVEVAVDWSSLTLAQTHLFKKEMAKQRKVWFKGDYAQLNTELNQAGYHFNLLDEVSNIGVMSTVDLKKAFLSYYAKTRKRLLKDRKISDPFRQLMLLDLSATTFSGIYSAKYIIGYSPIQRGQKRGDLTTPEGYYDDLLKLDSLSSPALMFCDHYKSVAEAFMKHKLDERPIPALWNDFQRIRTIGRSVSQIKPLTDAQWLTLDSVETQAIKDYVLTVNQRNVEQLRLATLSDSTTVVQLDSALRGEELLPALLKDYRGKVVLVDLWATWCGPCRRAMQSMAPIKEALKDKGVIYLFVTGETSPEGQWRLAIPKIHGVHYRLTSDQWSDLCTRYDFPGIPAYLVINRSGEVVYKKIGFPGVEEMKKELLNALNQ